MTARVSTATFFLIAIATLTVACKHERIVKRRAEILMGTRVEVTVRGEDSAILDKAMDTAFAAMRNIERSMNRFDPSSELSRINANAGGGEQGISDDMAAVLEVADRVNSQSDGAFDPTVGPAMKLWSRSPARFPTPDELKSIRHTVGWTLVTIDTRRKTIILPEGMALDLDGIAKGYGAGKALDALRILGIQSAMINAGGDVTCYSSKTDEPWKVGVSDPNRADRKPILALEMRNGSLATSGAAERFWEIGGVKYPWIIDPGTLLPPPDAPASASAFALDSAEADAWATAGIVMGKKIFTVDKAALAIIDSAGKLDVNDRWARMFGSQPTY